MNWDWLAGFIDGEGSFSILHHFNKVSRWYPRMCITQANLPILKEVQAWLGCGKIYEQTEKAKQSDSARQVYNLIFQGPDVLRQVCTALLPHLRIKQTQCQLLLDSLHVPSRERQSLAEDMRALNQREAA